jgi:hypothetical protein
VTTTPEENLQGLLKASWDGWISVLTAWQKAAESVYAAVAEWAVQEEDYLQFGQSECFVSSQHGCEVRAELRSATDLQGPLLPQHLITVTPSTIPSTATTGPVRVVVQVHGTKGSFVGRLVDAATGAEVEPDIYVSLG